jgi:hypothetical protein
VAGPHLPLMRRWVDLFAFILALTIIVGLLLIVGLR